MIRLLGLGLAARDRQQVLLSRDRDVVREEARNRKRDTVPILARAHDVVGRVVVLPFESVCDGDGSAVQMPGIGAPKRSSCRDSRRSNAGRTTGYTI
jgi:hypothetical protein